MSPISLLLISLPSSTAIPPKKQAKDGSDSSIQLGRGPMVSLLQQEALHVGETRKGLDKGTPRHPLERRSASEQMLPVAPEASPHSSCPFGPLSSVSVLFSSHVMVCSLPDSLLSAQVSAPASASARTQFTLPSPLVNPSKPCLHFSSWTQIKFFLLGVHGSGLHWFRPE